MSSPLAKRWARRPVIGLRPGLDSGVERLAEAPITINGSAPTPALRIVAADATVSGGYVTTWPARNGPTLEILDNGVDPTKPTGESQWTSGLTDAGNVWLTSNLMRAPSGQESLCDPGTKDVVIELVANGIAAASCVPIGRLNESTAKGWAVTLQTGTPQYLVSFGGATITLTAYTLSPYHLLAVLDRSGSGILYLNGKASSAVDISSITADNLAAAKLLAIGNYNGNDYAGVAGAIVVSFAQVIMSDGWLDTHDQAELARQRRDMLFGMRSAVAYSFPTARGIDFSLKPQIDKADGTQEHHLSPAISVPFTRRSFGGSQQLAGLLSEPAITELGGCPYFLFGPWYSYAPTGGGTTQAPVRQIGVVANSIREWSGSGGQIVQSQNASMSVGVAYVLDGFFKRGDRRYFFLGARKATGGHFSGVVIDTDDWAEQARGNYPGHTQGPTLGDLEIYQMQGSLSGWYRVRLTITPQSTDNYEALVGLSSDGTLAGLVFAGDPVTYPQGVYVWVVQKYAKTDYPISPFYSSTTGDLARPASVLTFDITGKLGGEFAIGCLFLAPSITPSARKTLLCLSDGTATNRIELYIHTDGTLCAETAIASGDAGTVSLAGSKCDAVVHEVLLTGRHNELQLWCDGVAATPDTAVDIPTGLTDLDVGHDQGGADHCAPVILSDVKIGNRFHSSWGRRMAGFMTAVLVGCIPEAAAPPDPARYILPMGDSITQGHGTSEVNAYRKELRAALAAEYAWTPDFIGSKNDGTFADNAHEGNPSWTCAMLEAGLPGWGYHAPDVILLMAGTCNMILPPATAEAGLIEMESLLDALVAKWPSARLCVSTIPPTTRPLQQEQTDLYNAGLPALVSAVGGTLYDIGGALETSDLQVDGVHVNDGGYTKMAGWWFDSTAFDDL